MLSAHKLGTLVVRIATSFHHVRQGQFMYLNAHTRFALRAITGVRGMRMFCKRYSVNGLADVMLWALWHRAANG